MNSKAIKKKLDNYMETATPEQVVKEFEELGVEFVEVPNPINLIQLLQATPKWKEFEDWYNKNPTTDIPLTVGKYDTYCGFIDLPIMYQKGVFEKFIEETCPFSINVDGLIGEESYNYDIYGSVIFDSKWYDSFEELLIWYFNN